jgi:hypothetical protein
MPPASLIRWYRCRCRTAQRDRDGRRLAASYANFLIVNAAVLVPVYGDPADQVALDRLADCFPGRAIIDIPCLPLISQNGSLHCATMQIPAGVLSDAATGIRHPCRRGARRRPGAAAGAACRPLLLPDRGPRRLRPGGTDPRARARAPSARSRSELGVVSSALAVRAPRAGLYHNTAVVFERDGSIAGKYRKMHIPDDPGYYEKFYFTPGDLGFTPIDTSVGRLGVLVCWDQWYPEAARLMALAGAELLLYPTAIGWDPRDARTRRLASAMRGSLYSAACGRQRPAGR